MFTQTDQVCHDFRMWNKPSITLKIFCCKHFKVCQHELLASQWIHWASSAPLITAFCGLDKPSGMMTSHKSLLGKVWKLKAVWCTRLLLLGAEVEGHSWSKANTHMLKVGLSSPSHGSSHAVSNRTALRRTVWRRLKLCSYRVPLPAGPGRHEEMS